MEPISSKSLPSFFRLDENENKKFGDFIKKMRKKYISSPRETAKLTSEVNKQTIDSLLQDKNISQAISYLRESSYETFLKEEIIFNEIILKEISKNFSIPNSIIKEISNNLFDMNIFDKEIFYENIINSFGKYVSRISPYIYALCLSNTQSRRSRAGQTFEGIIYYLYDRYGYSYDSQKKVGRSIFTSLELGKLVDSVLPGIKEFEKRRNKTIIGTMKTTLRERWQEVVEEVARSNIPSIHLLTVDDDISFVKMNQMSKHNIILVVLDVVKRRPHLSSAHSVIDFETYFLEELPEIYKYWVEHD